MDLRFLSVCVYVNLDMEEGLNIPERGFRAGMALPAEFGLMCKWSKAVHELHQDLASVKSYRIGHIVIHLNISLYDLYLKHDVSKFMDTLSPGLRCSGPFEVMQRGFFDKLRRVDVIQNMRHDKLARGLCVRFTPLSVDPIVQEIFKPWSERGIVRVSKVFRVGTS